MHRDPVSLYHHSRVGNAILYQSFQEVPRQAQDEIVAMTATHRPACCCDASAINKILYKSNFTMA